MTGELKVREDIKQYSAETTTRNLLDNPEPRHERNKMDESRKEKYERRIEREIADHIDNSEPSEKVSSGSFYESAQRRRMPSKLI